MASLSASTLREDTSTPKLISAASSSSSSSSVSSHTTLMDDVMMRLETKHEDAAMLLKRINSLLGLNEEAVQEVTSTTPRSREHSPVPTVSVSVSDVVARPGLPVMSSSSVSLLRRSTSTTSRTKGSGLKCGWFACWSMDGED